MKNAFGDDIEESVSAQAVNAFGDPIEPEKSDSKPGILKRIGASGLGLLGAFGEKIESVTTSPIAAGLSAALDVATSPEGLNKSTLSQIPEGLAAFGKSAISHFGRDPKEGPKYADVLGRVGLSTEAQPRMKMDWERGSKTYGQMIPGIPDSERVQGGVNPDGSIKYIGASQGSQPSPASAVGAALEFITPMPPVAGTLKGIGATAKMTGKIAEGTANIAAKTADIATGTKAASKTLGAIEGGMNNLGDALKARFGTELAPDASKHIETMIKNGIDPEKANAAVLFGPNSSASHLERARAETPIGETLRKHHKEFTDEVQGAIHKEIQRIGGASDDVARSAGKIPKSTQEAGELISNAYNNKVDEILNNSQDTYKSLSGRAPGAKIPPESMQKLSSKLDELAKQATDMGIDSFDDVTESQAKHLLGVVDKIKRSQGDLAATVRGLSGLGKTAFKTKYPLGAIPPDIAKLRSLYGDISESVVDGVAANFGQDVASSLRANNKAISEMFQDSKLIPALSDESKSLDRVFENLILNGDSKKIGVVKKYLSPEELQQTKAAVLEILNKETIQGDITFRNRLSQKLSDPNNSMNALFDKGELDNLKNLFQLGDRAGKSVLSSSGTGGSLAHQAASLGDIVRPDKWLNKAEEGVDKFAAGRQKKAASRAIGFELDKTPGRVAAKNPNQGTIMSMQSRAAELSKFNPRLRATRSFSSFQEDGSDK